MRDFNSNVEELELELEPDAHSCRAECNAYGYCQVCGAVVSGTLADYEERGYDPPEAVDYSLGYSMKYGRMPI